MPAAATRRTTTTRNPRPKASKPRLPKGDNVDFYSNATLKLDRQHMLWFNNYYSNVTSKGNIVGWYLDPRAHEPWHNRKIKAVRRHNLKTRHISKAVKENYNKLKLGQISTDFLLTAGELNSLNAIFEPKPEPQPEPPRPRLDSTEQIDLQKILNSINPQRMPTPPEEEEEILDNFEPKGDDAAAQAWQYADHQRKMEAARNRRLGGMMGKKKGKQGGQAIEFTNMWQGPSDDRWLE